MSKILQVAIYKTGFNVVVHRTSGHGYDIANKNPLFAMLVGHALDSKHIELSQFFAKISFDTCVVFTTCSGDLGS